MLGYLAQSTRVSSLSIDGSDYTSSMVEWRVSDASANENGLVNTLGEIILAQRPGGADIEDYDRNSIRRGKVVILDMKRTNGSVFRHPRGYLFVLSVAYDVEREALLVQVGCRISLALLTDDPSEILPLVPVPLDESRRTLQNCSASFVSAGMICYQNNRGALKTRVFFDGDSTSSTKPGEWVSVLGTTALSVSPLAGGAAIPDAILLSYQQPSQLTPDDISRVDTETSESRYFLNYPAMTWKRTGPYCTKEGPNGVPTQIACVSYVYPPSGGDTPSEDAGCGNAPLPPTSGR